MRSHSYVFTGLSYRSAKERTLRLRCPRRHIDSPIREVHAVSCGARCEIVKLWLVELALISKKDTVIGRAENHALRAPPCWCLRLEGHCHHHDGTALKPFGRVCISTVMRGIREDAMMPWQGCAEAQIQGRRRRRWSEP
jgi:hypothetical protein